MRQELEKRIEEFDLMDYKHFIVDNLEPCIKLSPRRIANDLIPLGKSKLGGSPDLPLNYNVEEIGEHLSFIAQLNCKDISRVDQTGIFPDEGILYFFYDVSQHVSGIELSEKSFWKVVYSDEDNHKLKRSNTTNREIYGSAQLEESEEVSFPDIEHEKLIDIDWPDEVQDNYLDFVEDHCADAELNHQVLGYPKTIQLEVFTEVLPLIQEDKKDDHITYDDLVLLFQVSTDENETDMVWGDNGILYFIITKQDLEKRDFDHVWLSLQSN